MDTKNSTSSDGYYKKHIERLQQDNKQLKQRLDLLEKENKELKKSLYDISIKYDTLSSQCGYPPKPFDLDSIKTEEENENTQYSSLGLNQHKSDLSRVKSFKNFGCKFTFKGHSAAIYTVQFSPCGHYLASGSFDKTVRVFDLASHQEVHCFAEHQLNVSDLAWSSDSSEILSGGYDHTVKLWDIHKGKNTGTYSTTGFVQSVRYNPSDFNTFYVGTTNKQILMFDKRQSNNNNTFENDSMINTIYVYKDGLYVLSGDSNGMLKLWDTRKDGLVYSQSLEESSKPISYIHVSKNVSNPLEEGKYLGVNSYDNVLRVYYRGNFVSSSFVSKITSNSALNHSREYMNLTHSLTGHKNNNWPIRSAFYLGKNYQYSSSELRDDIDDTNGFGEKNISTSFLLCSGSSDGYGYLFDIGDSRKGRLLQKLEGHKDRVYGVDWHPEEPMLATCSADSTIKLWGCKE